MTNRPKVSNRMRHLVMNLEADSGHYEIRGGRYSLAKLQESETALLSAIAELEQKAEKWKEAAVAYQGWRDAYFALSEDQDQTKTNLDAAQDRLEAATVALGDEWNEAVTASRQEAKP